MKNRQMKLLCLFIALIMIVTAFSSCGTRNAINNSKKVNGTTAGQSNPVIGGTTAALSTDANGNIITTAPGAKTTLKPGQTLPYKNNYTTIAGVTLSTVGDVNEISFDDITPRNYRLSESWDCMGMDNSGVIYMGWTCKRNDNGLEDCAIFTYNPSNGARKFIDTLMESSRKSNNLLSGEAIPKGHTKILNINGKMYLASQNFHDFKQDIDDLKNMRGAHIYCYDPASPSKGLVDLSAGLPSGVVIKNQGIVALNYMPSRGLIVGLTHPLSGIVFFDPKTNKVVRSVTGIPWTLGNPLSREIIVSGDKVYIYRGVEDAKQRNRSFNVYVYDYKTDKLTKTSSTCYGGFWNGQAATKDGKKIYVSTCCGELYVLDTATGVFKHLTHMLPASYVDMGQRLSYAYSITISPNEKKLYFIPTYFDWGSALYEYDIPSGTVSALQDMPSKVYTGNNIRDSKGNYYFGQFGDYSKSWSGSGKLIQIKISQ